MRHKQLVLLLIVSCKYIKSTLLCNHGQQGLDENLLCDLIRHRASAINNGYKLFIRKIFSEYKHRNKVAQRRRHTYGMSNVGSGTVTQRAETFYDAIHSEAPF